MTDRTATPEPVAPVSEMVERLRRLLERATPRPWFTLDPPWLPIDTETSILAGSPDPHVATFVADLDFCMMDEEDRANGRVADDPNADAELIVAAVNNLPQLLDALEASIRTPEAAQVEKIAGDVNNAWLQWKAGEWTAEEAMTALFDAIVCPALEAPAALAQDQQGEGE